MSVLLSSLFCTASWSIHPSSPAPTWYLPITMKTQASQWEIRMKQIISKLRMTALY